MTKTLKIAFIKARWHADIVDQALVGFNAKICAALSADAAKRLALLGEVACGYQFDVSNF